MAPDRDRLSGARPVVSFREDDEASFLTELERRSLGRHALQRRGVSHGRVAELRPDGLLPPRARRRRREAQERERWVAARPLVLPGIAERVRPALLAEHPIELAERLAKPGGLSAFLDERSERLAPRFRVVGPGELFDPERDVARVVVAAEDGLDDLWLKAGRLSLHTADRSLRVRVSFGRESDDDASRDEERHDLVGELARAVLPGARALERTEELFATLARVAGTPVRTTQHIAYWNAPHGGARFHHDAFDEPGAGGQLGVVYVQLEGRTVWLALSIEDLGARVREFLGWLAGGDAPWLREELAGRWKELLALSRDRRALLAELGLPGCGALGVLVDRGPEFTCFLADAGHAAVLHPGDALLLPNHGLERTAMHSVFCASERTTYALSLALRRGRDERDQGERGSSPEE